MHETFVDKVIEGHKYTCDICGEELKYVGYISLDGFERLPGTEKEGGGSQWYKYHFHQNCLFEFWKKNK